MTRPSTFSNLLDNSASDSLSYRPGYSGETAKDSGDTYSKKNSFFYSGFKSQQQKMKTENDCCLAIISDDNLDVPVPINTKK